VGGEDVKTCAIGKILELYKTGKSPEQILKALGYRSNNIKMLSLIIYVINSSRKKYYI